MYYLLRRRPGLPLSVAFIALALYGNSLFAQSCPPPSNNQIFNASLCVDGQVVSIGSNRLQDMVDALDERQLRQRFSTYEDEVSSGEFRLDVRGLPVTLNYQGDSTRLVFTVPSLGINQTFDGGTRDASNDLFEDYICPYRCRSSCGVAH